MKKIISILLVLSVITYFLPLLLFADPTYRPYTNYHYIKVYLPYRYVKVEGRQLLVDFDRDGVYEPYLIKGVGYQPFPVGRHPSDWGSNIYDDPQILERDFYLLQEMNCNTIRIWKGNDTQVGSQFQMKITTQTLNMAESHGIKVIAGFWIDGYGPYCDEWGQMIYNAPDFTNPTIRNDYLDRFEEYVREFKNHRAILFWVIGNENNNHIDPNNLEQIQAWYSLVDEMAERAHQVEGNYYHPVAVVNGELVYMGNSNYGTTDSQMPNLDIWGTNVYKGNSFGSLFDDFQVLSNKPLWIAEYGADAWHVNDFENPDIGYEDQATQAQLVGNLWDEVVLRQDICIGASLMEYSDEWWKPWEWLDDGIHNGEQNHFGVGPTDTDCPPDGEVDWWPQAPDSFFNEEWWGIMAIQDNGENPDIMNPRTVYSTLQDRFAN